MRLTDKVAIVSGGGSGIGEAIAVAFAREGAKVVIAGRNQEKLDRVAKEIGGACLAVTADVSDPNDIKKLVSAVLAKFKRIDALVNNAAVLLAGTAESLKEDEWDQTFDINVGAHAGHGPGPCRGEDPREVHMRWNCGDRISSQVQPG